jgi:beta-galactosidase
MINKKLPAIYYGGDYNPDQWPEEIWAEDMRLFKLAEINILTLPVFSWAKLQPNEETYDFGWLDRILDLIAKNGIYVCLATSTAAQPAWMSKKYPEILPVDVEGRKSRHGGRQNICPNSPKYRELSAKLAGKLAERYRNYPGLLVWHVSNEYITHCYCENCAAAFRNWLKSRYGTLEEVNRRWYMNFWGHTVYDWEEIVPPSKLGGDYICFQGMCLDYKRFMSDSILECYLGEYRAIKAFTPDIPVTTNTWGLINNIDWHRWAEYMDVAAWDHYPAVNPAMPDPITTAALRFVFIRGIKNGQPFMLMEQTPSQQNWAPYNTLKRPGVMRLWSFQALARGADSVMFFQMRRSIGACEKNHGAVIAHAGHENTRVFRECAQLGRELKGLGDTLLDSRLRSGVAILMDIDNWNAVDLSSGPSKDLKYYSQIEKYYHSFYELNIPVDVVNPTADLSGYRMVVAPVLYMVKPGVAERIKNFVKQGGYFVTTFFSGIVDGNDRVTPGGYPGELRDVFGIWVEEMDALPPEMKNSIVMKETLGGLHGSYECGMLCALPHLEGAQALAVYGKDFYSGMPVLTENQFGQGKAYYIASDPEAGFLKSLVKYLCDQKGIKAPLEVAAGVEVTQRFKGEARGQTREEFTFLLNHNDEEVTVHLKDGCYTELLSGQEWRGEKALNGKDVAILQRRV